MLTEQDKIIAESWFKDYISVVKTDAGIFVPFDIFDRDTVYREYMIKTRYGVKAKNPPDERRSYYKLTELGERVYLFYHL
jgi:hypothetical protein